MVVKYNPEIIKDKIKACWIGKNIGGTIGAPYEAQTDFNDVSGFTTAPGKPLPNDDLDLQLVWLLAMELEGPHKLNSATLGEYWITNIPPYWNEYGNGKANMQLGLMPPFCGEYENERWKRSNGAWIRSEIWACLSPGIPEIALKFALMDACIDHGMSDGTYAELFTAALECNAFFEKDLRKNIAFALSKIPSDCRIANAVKLAVDSFDKKLSLREARDLLVEQSKDIGYFQAPSHIGFVVLGLLYGNGDFKKSVLYAVNCGDDTDCTAATVGSVMGITYGTEIIPKDWQEYIGDEIITTAVNGSEWRVPKTCSELADRVFNLIPSVIKHSYMDVEFDSAAPDQKPEVLNLPIYKEPQYLTEIARHECLFDETRLMRSPYSYDAVDNTLMYGYVEFEKEPVIKPYEPIMAKIKLTNRHRDSRNLMFKVFLPEGWTAEYRRSLYMEHYARNNLYAGFDTAFEVKITPNENIDAINRIPVEITVPGRPTVTYCPIILLG